MGAPTRTGLAAIITLVVGVHGGCTGTAPAREIGPPDIAKISVFYPVNGQVYGRGSAGAFADPTISHVVVASLPTGGETILPVEEDGSFDFGLIALSDDILEVAGARDGAGAVRGDPSYIRVPPLGPPLPRYFCCEPAGTCTSEDAYKASATCADPIAGATRCESVRECRTENREILAIDTASFQITAPNTDGRISITGVIAAAGALVRLENRGKAGVGGRNPGIMLGQLSDENGRFRFRSIEARGDDELVFQVEDLLGNRSPQAAVLVPDAPVETLDLVGAYPFVLLDNGKPGTVGVRFHAAGLDGRGICPDSTSDPVLCFSGGLTHDMVSIDQVSFDGVPIATPRATPSTSAQPNTRATEGDPLKASQNVILVLDHSDTANAADGVSPRRFEAMKQLIRTLRKRDRVGLVTYGGAGPKVQLPPTPSGGDWATQLAMIDAIAATPAEGAADVFGAIRLAGTTLHAENSTAPGRIIVLALGDADGTQAEATEAFVLAYDQIDDDPTTGFPGFGVYVIGNAIPEPVIVNGDPQGNIRNLESIAEFSAEGRFVNMPSIASLDEALGDAAGFLSGSFVLLYDMAIPEAVGKSARLRITATVNLPTRSGGVDSATATYEGPIRIDGSEE